MSKSTDPQIIRNLYFITGDFFLINDLIYVLANVGFGNQKLFKLISIAPNNANKLDDVMILESDLKKISFLANLKKRYHNNSFKYLTPEKAFEILSKQYGLTPVNFNGMNI